MGPRERVLSILDGKKTDRLPVDLWYTPEIGVELKNHFGAEDDYAIYEALGLDKIVWTFPEYNNPNENQRSGSQVGAEAAGERTMWGVPLKKVQSGKAVYHEFGVAPLKDYQQPEQLDDYPYWPNPNYVDYEGSKKAAQKASAKYATIGPWISFYEIYCQMRGIEQSLMDIMTSPRLVDGILDRIENIQTKMLKKFIETAGDDLDMVFFSDDMAMQQNLIMSLDTWEKFFRDRVKRWCDLIHSYDKKVFYHSDGAVEPLIPALLECDIDILNPIQHVCPGMGIENLKKKYGQKVIFHGGIDNQFVLPFGSVKDVQAETKSIMRTLGADNSGCIICSCHNVQAGTPVENIIAMVETVKAG